MNRFSRYLIVSAGVLLVLMAVFLLGHASNALNRLESYKARLKAQGEQLTLAELMHLLSTNSDNGVALMQLTNAVAQIGNLGSGRFIPGALEPRKFVGPAQARVLWLQEHPRDFSKPKSKNIWQDFADELESIQGPLTEIRESLKQPPADGGPSNGPLGNRNVNFVAVRTAAQWLSGAALCELHQGHLEAALQNLEALAAAGQLNRDEYTLVAQMIRVAVCGLGFAVSWEALQASGWTDPQLRRFQGAWEANDLLAAVEKGLLGERAGGIEIWATLHSPNGAKKISSLLGQRRMTASSLQDSVEDFADIHLFTPIYKMTSVNDDELFFLRSMEESIDAVRATERGSSWSQERGQVNKTLNLVLRTSTSLERLRYTMTLMALPNLVKAGDVAARTETERRLTVTAIALKRFELRHQTLPSTLEELVPEFLAAVPKDPMSGKLLRYHWESSGQCCLYSVGLDGQDDGGDATCATNKYGFWEGPDAVWPTPAK